MFVFLRHFFVHLFVCYFVLDRPQFALMRLYNIRVPLNCANCWNFQIDKRNLDIALSASSNRLFFNDLLIIIFVRGKADHHYYRSTFLKKALFDCIISSKPDSFPLTPTRANIWALGFLVITRQSQ